jgi:hypothetical protein
MKLVSTIFAGLLALNAVSTDALAGPHNGGKSGSVVRSQAPAHKKKVLRSLTGAQFVAEAKADAKRLLAELRGGLRITEVKALGQDAITGTTAVLATVSSILGGDIAGITLRFKKDNQLLIRLSKVTAAPSGTTTTTPATEQPAEALEDGDE